METVGSLIDFGNYGRVYRLASDPTKVVKIPHYFTCERVVRPRGMRSLSDYRLNASPQARADLEKEAAIAMRVHLEGFPLPTPRGIIPLVYSDGTHVDGFVSDYFMGQEFRRLAPEQQKRLVPRITQMIADVRAAGYFPGFETKENMLYDSCDDTLVFCDFGMWEIDWETRGSVVPWYRALLSRFASA